MNTGDLSAPNNYEAEIKKLLLAGHSINDPHLATRLKSQQVLLMQSLLTKNRFLVPHSVIPNFERFLCYFRSEYLEFTTSLES